MMTLPARLLRLLALPLATGLCWSLLDWPLFSRLLDFSGGAASGPEAVLPVVGFALSLTLLSAALVLVVSLLPGWLVRSLLGCLSLCAAVVFTAGFLYGTPMTPDMMRNFLETDLTEASAYLSAKTVLIFIAACLPGLAVSLFVPLPRLPGPEANAPAARKRPVTSVLLTVPVFIAAALGLILLNFQFLAGAMRSDRSMRYQIAPLSLVWSSVRTLAHDGSAGSVRERAVIDPAPKATVRLSRPAVLVVVVGETARAGNWGLSGYGRQTTPRLAGIDGVLNFPAVTACGTSTEVSLPCMMSRIGRSNYSRKRILGEEQLPSLLARAGVHVAWVDNQSGCKGACSGVESLRPETLLAGTEPMRQFCANGECGDAILVPALERLLSGVPADRPSVLFLHMMGSHGPAYFRRSRQETKRFLPECTDADLSSCPRETVVNAYDNSILETDRVLSDLIATLRSASGRLDGALLYVSDHGESLGEKGLFLHGAPWWLAPREQTEVPFIAWIERSYADAFGISLDNVRHHAAAGGVSQEWLYSSVLGLAGVESTSRNPERDLTR